MTPGNTRPRGLFLTVLAVSVLWVAYFTVPHMAGRGGVIDGLEFRLVDLRYTLAGPRSAVADVVIVAIDDETLATDSLGQEGGRIRLEKLISSIAQSGARALALDVLLADRGDPAEDAALARALSELPSAIAAAALFGADGSDPNNLIWPQPNFTESAQVGLVNLSTDARRTPRYAPLLFYIDEEWMPSLALVSTLAFSGEKAVFSETHLTIGNRRIPLDEGLNMPLRFVGPAGSIPTYSASTFLDGSKPSDLSGKLVVLGFSASAMGDRFVTPFDDSTPGVEIIATTISQLIGGATLRRDGQVRKWDTVHAAILTLLCVLLILVCPLSRGIPAALVLLVLSMISVTVFFANGLWLSAALPLTAAMPPMLVAGVARYTRERKLAKHSERTLASLRRFHSPALTARIESDPEYLANPLEQELVVLFVDLTGFTGLSQQLGSTGTRNLLRHFHRLTAEAVETNGGSVFNYMGDGALAVFGLEEIDFEAPAESALDAAFDLVKTLSQQKLDDLPNADLRCRIGLHAGFATLSRLGADSHQQVTVTGDNVNLASRLMEVAKAENAVIVASEKFTDALREPKKPGLARQTIVRIRGRSGNVRVLLWTADAIGKHVKPE